MLYRDLPFDTNGCNYEAAEMMACMRAGNTKSDIMSLNEILSIMQITDQLWAQWG